MNRHLFSGVVIMMALSGCSFSDALGNGEESLGGADAVGGRPQAQGGSPGDGGRAGVAGQGGPAVAGGGHPSAGNGGAVGIGGTPGRGGASGSGGSAGASDAAGSGGSAGDGGSAVTGPTGITHSPTAPLHTATSPSPAIGVGARVASSGDTWLITYIDNSLALGGRLLAEDGSPVGFGFDIATGAEVGEAKLTFDGDDFVVVWLQTRGLGPRELWYRHVSTSGEPLGQPALLRPGNDAEAGHNSRFAIAGGDGNAFVIACGLDDDDGCESILIGQSATSVDRIDLPQGPAEVGLTYGVDGLLATLLSYDTAQTSLLHLDTSGVFVEAAPMPIESGGKELWPSAVPYQDGFLVGWSNDVDVRAATVDAQGKVEILPKPLAPWSLGMSGLQPRLVQTARGLGVTTTGALFWLDSDLTTTESDYLVFSNLAAADFAADASAVLAVSSDAFNRLVRATRTSLDDGEQNYIDSVTQGLPFQRVQTIAPGSEGFLVSFTENGQTFLSKRADDGSAQGDPVAVPAAYSVAVDGVTDIVTVPGGWLLAWREGNSLAVRRFASDGTWEAPATRLSPPLIRDADLAETSDGALLVTQQVDSGKSTLVAMLLDASGNVTSSRALVSGPSSEFGPAPTLDVFPKGSEYEVVWAQAGGVWSQTLAANGEPLDIATQVATPGDLSLQSLSGVAWESSTWLLWDGPQLLTRPVGSLQSLGGGGGSLSALVNAGVLAWADTLGTIHVGLGTPSGELNFLDTIPGVSTYTGGDLTPVLSKPRGSRILCAFPQLQRAYGTTTVQVMVTAIDVQ